MDTGLMEPQGGLAPLYKNAKSEVEVKLDAKSRFLALVKKKYKTS
jgi:hypothetical protein